VPLVILNVHSSVLSLALCTVTVAPVSPVPLNVGVGVVEVALSAGVTFARSNITVSTIGVVGASIYVLGLPLRMILVWVSLYTPLLTAILGRDL